MKGFETRTGAKSISSSYKFFGSINQDILAELIKFGVKGILRHNMVDLTREQILRLCSVYFAIQPDVSLKGIGLVRADMKRFLKVMCQMREVVIKRIGDGLGGINQQLSNIEEITDNFRHFNKEAYANLLKETRST